MDFSRITSRANSLIVDCVKLKDKKYRDSSHLFFLEGEKLNLEAASRSLAPVYIFIRKDLEDRCGQLFAPLIELCEKGGYFIVSREVFSKLSTENSPQGIIACYRYLENVYDFDGADNVKENFNNIKYVFKSFSNRYIILERIQDPGNLGTIIRSACALGISALLLVDCADVYHPRTIRASMGGIFNIPICRFERVESAVSFVRRAVDTVYGAGLGQDSINIKLFNKCWCECAVIIGSEGEGLSEKAVSLCDKIIKIPMVNAQSLNAASAASIIMWEMTSDIGQ